MHKILLSFLALFFFSVQIGFSKSNEKNWDDVALWEKSTDGKSSIELHDIFCKKGHGIELNYSLKDTNWGWVQIKKSVTENWDESVPVTFFLKADSPSLFEVKFIDKDGSVFIKTVELKDKYQNWTPIVLYMNNMKYGWGGDQKFDGLQDFCFAVSGKTGSGTVWLDEITFAKKGLKSSFPLVGPQLDPDRESEGFGFRQRRHEKLIPEDSLVYEWFKQQQDIASKAMNLMPSMEDHFGQTFNNALCAIAFILKNDKERSERILDFYSNATDPDNEILELQNFYYKGEARGFYQNVDLTKPYQGTYYALPNSPRWMGDMAWLLIAYKYYQETYHSDRYQKIMKLMKDLLVSYYKPAKIGGYIQHGWGDGDSKLHESYGHHEGNIDCYAVFKLFGENEIAEKIKLWLDSEIKGNNFPLDCYSWQYLSHEKEDPEILNIPEYDFRFRRTLTVNGKKVTGFFTSLENENDNLWLDGTGHMACAFYDAGNWARGNFYANQYDPFIFKRNIDGIQTKTIPYTANKVDYDWVDTNKGFTGTVAWYIFAKNQFNPLTLQKNKKP